MYKTIKVKVVERRTHLVEDENPWGMPYMVKEELPPIVRHETRKIRVSQEREIIIVTPSQRKLVRKQTQATAPNAI